MMRRQNFFKSFLKNSVVSLVVLSTILGTTGPFYFFPQTALAVAPHIDHWSVWQADGDDTATTTVYTHVFAGDDTAVPGTDLTVTTIYKGASTWGYWASSTCYAEYDNSNKFRCPLPIIGGSDIRTYKYYIEAFDGTEFSYRSWATDTDSRVNARNYPVQTTILNTPGWTNGVSAQTMDGRQYYFSRAIAAGASTIYISSTTPSTANLAVNDWIALKSTTGLSEPKVQILSITGFGQTGTEYEVAISGYTSHAFSTSDYVQEFLDNALVWIDGTTVYGTTTAQQATTTFGGISLYNIPNGFFDAVAFKQGYGEQRITNLYLSGTSTSTLNFILSFGGFQGGTNLKGASVLWSAPSDGMMGAPANIGLAMNTPIMIALSQNASSSTITKNNIKLQTATAGGTFTDFPSYYGVAYEPMNQNVTTTGLTDYDFGQDAKIIVYSTTTLATSTGYVVKLNSNIKDVNNNQIQGNTPGGGYTLFFSTSGGFFSSGGITAGNFGTGGSFMPPYVMNAMPNSGAMSVARNTKIAIQFDQAMSASSLSGNIELRTLDSAYQEGTSIAITSALADTDKSLLIITPSANLAANTRYRVKLLGGLQSSSGVPMAPPGSTMRMFEMEFETGSSADSSAPTILATGLDRFGTSTSYTAVPTSIILKTSFSESIDPTTINTTNLYLRSKGSTSNLSATVEYDIMEGKALLAPFTALNATTTYILTLTGYIKDLTGAQNALATTTYEFTTGGADTTGSILTYFNADDFSLSLTFDEPMNAAKVTDTSTWPSGSTKWQTSVLNSANYIIYVDNGAPPTGSIAKYYSVDSLASSSAPATTLTYDALFKTVKITGLSLLSPAAANGSFTPSGVRVWVKNATDISGNTIQGNTGPDAEADNFGSNSMGGPVKSSMETFGMMGPGGGMFAPPTSVGTFTMTDFGGKNPAMMGMMPVGIWPMNMMAGATSTYMIDIPISSGKAIPASGKIILGPFPDEAVVSMVRDADPNKAFAHNDINGPGAGQVQIASVTVSGQTVTVNLGSVATQAPDFLHLELDNIKNPTTPSQGGYKISIQTQTSGSIALESFTSMPFFIMPKGKYTIIGHVTTTDVGLNGVQVFGGSPSTGPLFTTTANNAFGSSTNGEFKIDGLNSGSAMLMTEQSVSVGSDEYIASVSEPVFIDDSTSANTTGAAIGGGGNLGCTSATTCYVYKKITLTKVATGTTPGLVVYIYGDFATSTGTGFMNLDIFAGGPNGFRVKQVTLNGDYSAVPYSTVLNLPSTGDYNVAIGPAMPKVMGRTAPKMPTNWLPPKPVNVSVSGSGGTWTWAEVDSASVGTSTDDGLVRFTIQAANKTVSGYVYDTSGTAVANAEVFAYSPSEFYGTNAHTRNDGSFTLNVRTGYYKVGAFLPGAPPTGEIGVEVRDSSVYVDGVLTTSLNLKISKDIQSGYTISGTVYSDTNSQYPATDVSVYAYRTDGPGHAETMTDSKGTYTLYVGSGTWKVGAALGSYGKITEKTVVVPPSKSGLKLTPDTTTNYVTIRERIWEDKDDDGAYDAGEGVSRASVSFIATSTDYTNSAVTDSNGLYELKVPATTTYDIYAWSPDVGNLAPEKNKRVTSTDIIYTSFSGWADIRMEQATTVEFGIYAFGGTTATTADKLLIQLDRMGVAGVSNDVYKEGVATTTILVSTSTTAYILDIKVQGIPKDLLTITTFNTDTTVTTSTVGTKIFATTTVNGYEKIKIILPPISYVSGQVRDELGNAVANAILHIEQPGKDVEFDVEADSSGNYSFRVASSSSPYLIQADKGGYVDSAVSVYASTSAVSFNPSLQTSNNSISGTVTINGAVPGGTEVYVWAEQLGGGYASTAKGDPQTGAYTLKVTAGDWDVYAAAEGYSAQSNSLIIQTSGGDRTGVNFNIASSRTLAGQETLGMAGNVGGTLSDKDSSFEMAIPRSALSASDSSSYNVSHKEVSNIPTFTPTGNLVGNNASEVTAYKPNGAGGNASTISGLQNAAFIDKTFTIAELSAEGITTSDQVEETKMGSYDSTANNWTMLPTTITYLDSLDKPVVPTATLSNVSKVVFNGATKHFSTFGVINSKYDGLAPAVPTSVTVSDLGNGKLQISWSAVTTNSDGTSASDIQRYAIYRSQDSGGSFTRINTVPVGTTSYTDTVSGGTYYYRVTADSGLQSGFSGTSGGSSSFSGSSGGSGTVVTTPVPAAPASAPAPAPEKIALAPKVPAVPAKKEITLEGITIPKLEKPVSQMTKTELTAKIAEFLAVISQLQVLVAQLAAEETPSISDVPANFKFGITLKPGQTSDDIKYLQIVLNSDPETIITESGLGSAGKETKFFGALTRAAIIRFQEKYASEILSPYGLTKGTGIVGPSTRAKLNKLLGK